MKRIKMIRQKHLKARASRAPEKGISTAHGSEIVHLSPARRLSPGASVLLCAALLVALLFGPVGSRFDDRRDVARPGDPVDLARLLA